MSSIFKFWMSNLGKIEIELTPKQAESVSDSDDNVRACLVLMRNARVKKQLDKHSPELIRSVLDEYTVWEDKDWQARIDSGELTIEKIDRIRLLWIAGGDIMDEIHAKKG